MRLHNMKFRRNVNNNVRRNESVKGKKGENLDKTFVRERTHARNKIWVEKTKNTLENKIKLVVVAEIPWSI